ncbi:sentrin-specific protease 2 isoform X1 [Takifugu rubripes]|uniref:sentrin-specific protease 2 isoform X1 n=1 Tax=Takifugu rubripes TaxID=31033 RepID=UPI0011458C89|nr:sentrin-specific protease 2-like isoform X1 [Takifugu rubripes]
MYGWIVDGIFSLFEPVTTGKKPTEWSGKGNVSEEASTRPGVKVRSLQQENHARPAKRHYQSVHVGDGACNTEVEVKRRRRDVVISFVKKAVVGVAGLLGLKNPNTPRPSEEAQPITLIGIDELQTSWLASAEWRMNKQAAGNERGKTLFQSYSPTLMRKYRAGQSAGYSDRGKDWEKRGSVQLLPSRPALQLGASTEPTCNGIGRNRNYKPSLTVEETIKQNNKEHYRRFLEFELLSQSGPRTAALRNPFDSVPMKMGVTAASCMFPCRNAQASKERWDSLPLSKTFSGAFGDAQSDSFHKQKQTTEMDLSTEVAIRLSLVDREASPVSPPGALSAPSRHSEEDIPRLTKEMATAVSRALAQSDPNLVLSAAFKLRITQRDLATLQEGGWLNDEVINFYLSLIMERSTDQAAELKVYSFSTFFFPKLRGGGGGLGGHAQVKRWTKAVDLFSYDLVLVPLHLDVHWALAVIDLKSKTVVSYDSMGHRHDDICKLLLLYLKDEHKAKKGKELDETKWTVGNLRATEAPQQKNGSDCGVFACKYADYIAKERPLTFKQCHMPLFRKLMIWEILNQKLL